MLCGAGSFSRVDEDPWSPPTPRGSRRKQGSSNPYSTRGLDKFSMVLADLESRRERIMAKAGAQGVSVIRFVYSNSHDWVPIIVKPREQRPELDKPKKGAAAEAHKEPDAAAKEHPAPPRAADRTDVNGAARAQHVTNWLVKKSFSWKVGKREGSGFFSWNPSYYWPTVLVLILLSLAFGRVFAICCTSIWWYSVPCMKVDESRGVRKSLKKNYGRWTSEKKLGAGGGDVAVTPGEAKKDEDLVGLASPRHHRTSTAKRGPC